MKQYLWVVALLVTASPYLSANRTDQISVQQLKYSVGNLRNELDNHEAEIQMFEQRLNNQEATLELLREELHNKKAGASVQGAEEKIKALVGDTKKLLEHANQLSEAIHKTESRVGKIESTVEQQGKNIKNLQEALQSVLGAFNLKETTNSEPYRVKSGDSLEKIARKHNTTIKKLKEINGLKNDRIRIGQKLTLP